MLEAKRNGVGIAQSQGYKHERDGSIPNYCDLSLLICVQSFYVNCGKLTLQLIKNG